MNKNNYNKVMYLLKGNAIKLRGLEFEDLESINIWMNDFDTMTSILRIEPSVKYFTEIWFKNINTDNTKKILAIEHNNNFIGCVGVNNISYLDRKSELYIYIGDKKYRDKGLAKEAIKLFLSYMFDFYNIHKMYLHVREDNSKAINLYKKIGFKEEGIFIEEKYIAGKYINIIRMAILKGDFKNEKNSNTPI